MPRWTRSVRAFALGTLLLLSGELLTGCGGGSGATIEKVVPVSGTLTYKGMPLASHQVLLQPEDGRRPALGVSDASGKFTLGTNDVGDGAPPGRSRVAVVFSPQLADTSLTSGPIDDPKLLPKPDVKIPVKYTSAATSGLTEDIPESGVTDLRIDLK